MISEALETLVQTYHDEKMSFFHNFEMLHSSERTGKVFGDVLCSGCAVFYFFIPIFVIINNIRFRTGIGRVVMVVSFIFTTT